MVDKASEKVLSVDELATFCKRKGFVYPSGEIYGGLAGLYDYGHFGTLLKRNFEQTWRNYFLRLADNYVEIEASEIMPEKVFVASGHLKNFNESSAVCKKGHIERADHLLEAKAKKRFEGLTATELFAKIKEQGVMCSTCGGSIEKVEALTMMFPLSLGVVNPTRAYLRPETAQSPYVDFKLQAEVMRKKFPLGIALVGKAYRNEISPRNFILRQRAFTQAELQIFFNPSKINEYEDFGAVSSYHLRVVLSDQREKEIQLITCKDLAKRIPRFYVYHLAKVQQFYLDVLKFPVEKFRLYELDEKERAFYNKYHFDMEANLDTLGWTEIGGVHYRTDHDLKGHQEISKQKLEVFDEESKERFIPHVLELSFGVDRNFYALLNFAYTPDAKRENIVLKLPAFLAPVKVAVFPLISKGSGMELARRVYEELREEFSTSFDVSGSIGRRYARQDEVGTPFCITIDEESVKDKSVTVRERDSTKQIRVKVDALTETLRKLVAGKIAFTKAGKVVETRVK